MKQIYEGHFFTIVIQIAILGVILCGCKGPQPEEEKLLLQAELLMDDHPDSAFLYFHKGLEIAEIRGDKNYQSLLTQNLSVAYRNTGQFDEAETYLIY